MGCLPLVLFGSDASSLTLNLLRVQMQHQRMIPGYSRLRLFEISSWAQLRKVIPPRRPDFAVSSRRNTARKLVKSEKRCNNVRIEESESPPESPSFKVRLLLLAFPPTQHMSHSRMLIGTLCS